MLCDGGGGGGPISGGFWSRLHKEMLFELSFFWSHPFRCSKFFNYIARYFIDFLWSSAFIIEFIIDHKNHHHKRFVLW